jgi:acetylornithine/N-succinyldiaminopimelate aminotransferase
VFNICKFEKQYDKVLKRYGMTNRQLFFNHLAQTSLEPPAFEFQRAKGIYLIDANGRKYMDLISGISVSNVGHNNTKVSAAIKKQLSKHSHLMVYGEYIVAPQVEYANILVEHLPKELNNVYFVSSGSEAVEGALKLSKRYTGRTEIVSFKNAYHGSTQGALSVMGDEEMKQAFRPLLPDVRFLEFNNEADLKQITNRTACVIVEPIQGEAGVIVPKEIQDDKLKPANYLQSLKNRCKETGTLLIFDEIQTGMGRTGEMFAFEKYNVVPDILCLAKAFGGGLPLGVFISSKEIMSTLSYNPVLGHITTFGGHPLSCVAGMAAFKEIERLKAGVEKKGLLFKKLLVHPLIKEVRGEGLLLAVQFESNEENKRIIIKCVEQGVITDWFLFNASSMRIAPPLIITEKEIKMACKIILANLE